MNLKKSNIGNKKIDPEKWVDRYGDYLYRFTLLRIGDPAVAQELVQESFLAALSAKKRFNGYSSEKTWLTGILKHKIVDFYRRKSKERAIENIESVANVDESYFDDRGRWRIGPAKWDVNPFKIYEQKEFMKLLNNCLSKLPKRLSAAFIFREIEGFSTKEICDILNISNTNCWVMLYRARMNLRRCMETEWLN